MAFCPGFVGLELIRRESLIGSFTAALEVLQEALIALLAVQLPLAKQVQSQGPQQRAKLSVGALLIGVKKNVPFEYLAQVDPKLVRPAQALIIEQILQLGHINHLK